MPLHNDTRGWIMTAMSGLACILGASIICVDLVIRRFPGHRDFKIQENNLFLSCSLSLSFGVMLFSSLYSMLPSAKQSLVKSGIAPKPASWILIACFIGGAAGIQVVSRVLHHYMPSHVVDCDHSHDEENGGEMTEHDLDKSHQSLTRTASRGRSPSPSDDMSLGNEPHRKLNRPATLTSRVSQLVSGAKAICDDDGQCLGFTDPCGTECFKIIGARGGIRFPIQHPVRQLGINRTASAPLIPQENGERQSLLPNLEEHAPLILHSTSDYGTETATLEPEHAAEPSRSVRRIRSGASMGSALSHSSHARGSETHGPHAHHHHVPTNAFLSIGLQTSIAIALHKLPEGFITYATNHANPRLGFAVFLALFIHNITEGFAMALPLYLAINSRWKAMFWSSLLGGVSQPMGAGVAALWFKIAGNKSSEPGEGVYGAMFAVTAGIMVSVALQLFSESLDLTHNRNLCMMFAFAGMAILGASSALTAA